MMQLVFFLEERSAEEMLKGLLSKILPEEVTARFVVFEGKQDLEKRLPIRLRAWQDPDARFIILRDQDAGDCERVKARLLEKCQATGRANYLVRIACRELETFYLGDLAAVAAGIGPPKLATQQNKAKYRAPDNLASPKQELKRLAPDYQPIAGSRAIGPCLNLDNNRSHSFRVLIQGIRQLVGGMQ